MTHRANQHRKMEVRNGRAITKARWRFIRAYLQRRSDSYTVSLQWTEAQRWRYVEWVQGFERFMINGLD